MTTTVTVAGTEIQYEDFEITIPTSPVDVAPSASITTNATESISANDQLTITIDGTTAFQGRTRSGGTKATLGGVTVEAAHAVRDIFEDTVSFTEDPASTAGVLQAALDNADGGGDFTLDYAGSTLALNNPYVAEDRTVKRVFSDMMDRTSRIWWVDPGGTTIHVAPKGDRGTWKSIDTQQDRATLSRFDEGNVDTVRNAVTVVGTGEEEVRATAVNNTSINTYGRRPGNSPYNISYVTTQSEAQAIADELLVPDPLPEARLLVGSNVGNVVDPLVNYEVDVTDTGKNVDASGLQIEQHTIEQGRATLQIGAGSGVSIEDANRRSRSRDDLTDPGSVYGTDRLAENSVDTPQLVDTSVINAKIDDLAVETDKLEDNAVINGKLADFAVTSQKLDDLSVSETKISDDAISTPKLQAEAVTASEILAGTITAQEIASTTITTNEIAADTITASDIAAGTITALEILSDTITAAEIAAGTITSLEIESGTITANEIDAGTITSAEIAANTIVAANIDSLDLDTNQLTVSDPGTDGQLEFRNEQINSVDTIEILQTDSSGFGAIGTFGLPWDFVFATRVRPDSDNVGNVGTSSNAYSEMHAYAFIDADTGSELTDGGDVLAGLERGQRPPDFCRECDDDGEEIGLRINDLTRHLWEICTAQQERISDLEQRISRLEEQV